MRTGGTFEPEALPPHQHPTAGTVGWKSPVPYLFGGLAAMLGLIAFALLILACSYWKLSGNLDGRAAEESSSEEKAGEGREKGASEAVFANSVLVIMAGEAKPTFLATPATSRASSFEEDGKTTTTTTTTTTTSRSSNSSGSSSSEAKDDVEKK